MDFETIKNYLQGKPAAEEDMPFGPDVIVFKVKGKMFALLAWKNDPLRVNVKCDPVEALMLRDMYDGVIPGYHMNKKHWNTVIFDGTVPEGEIYRMVDRSYELVVKGLKKADRVSLQYL